MTVSREHQSTPENSIETRINFIDAMIQRKQSELAVMQPILQSLLEKRHQQFEMPRTMFVDELAIADQLYADPTYNDTFIFGNHIVDESGQPKGGDLNARNGGESYSDVEAYDSENEYSQAILNAAQRLGFVLNAFPDQPTEEIDQFLGIADSNLEKIYTPVQAVIVPTARGLSNPMRIRSAIRDIEQGKVDTKLLIIASCERPVDEKERELMDAKNLHYGTTEYGSAIAALNDVVGLTIDEEASVPFELTNAPHLQAGRMVETTIPLGEKDLRVVVLSAPFDSERVTGRDQAGNIMKQNRASTLDNFNAALEYLPEEEGDVVVESHDTWIQSQAEVAEQYIGVKGKNVIPAGPHKLDRLKKIDGKIVLNEPGQVVDEIAKTFAFKVQTIQMLENAKQELIAKR